MTPYEQFQQTMAQLKWQLEQNKLKDKGFASIPPGFDVLFDNLKKK